MRTAGGARPKHYIHSAKVMADWTFPSPNRNNSDSQVIPHSIADHLMTDVMGNDTEKRGANRCWPNRKLSSKCMQPRSRVQFADFSKSGEMIESEATGRAKG